MSSVKLLVRAGPLNHAAVEVSVELIADATGHVEVEAQARGNNQIGSDAAVGSDRHAVANEVQQDRLPVRNVADDSRDVGDRHAVGVGNIATGLGHGISFLGHGYSSARANLSGASAAVGTGKVAA